jgi:hypothetical protein
MFTPVQVATSGAPSKSGLIKHVEDKAYVSVYTVNTALVANVPLVIVYDGDASNKDQRFITGVPGTLTGAVNCVVVPQAAATTGTYAWVQIFGEAEAALIAQNIVAGDYLEVLNSGVSLTPTSTTRRVSSCAMAIDASTVAQTASVFLFGIPTEIAATT